MKNIYKNRKINDTFKVSCFLGAIQIIVVILFSINHLSLPSFNNEGDDYGTYAIIETPKVSTTSVKDTTPIQEKEVVKPVRYVQTVTKEVVSVTPVTKTVKVSKVVPVKKFVVKKRKIEIIEMTSIPALSVSNTELNYNNDLALDTFIKQNEIITEAIEIIDSVEVTENDTNFIDSTYYVLEINTIAKNEEPATKTTINNPNTKIVPIKWNDKKIWTKADTNDRITTNAKGNWTLYKNENTETATTQTGSSKETTYGGYKILLPSTPDEGVTNNLEDYGYQTDILPNQKMKETIYWPPPIFDKWHWQENMLNILLYQQLLE